MHNNSSEEKLAKLADTLAKELNSQPHEDLSEAGTEIKIKGNSGTINFGTQVNLNEHAKEQRALLPGQRKQLHGLRAQCEALGDDPRDVWREVHNQLGVSSLDEVTSVQFAQAKGVIQARLERLQEEADKNRLVAKILRLVDDKNARPALHNFCELSFGRTQLVSLKRIELTRVLEFVQQQATTPEVVVTGPKPQSQTDNQEGIEDKLKMLSEQRWGVLAIFSLGVLVGALCF